MARQKKTIITGVSKEAAEEAFAIYAKASAEYSKITADIELKCAQIREKFQDKLSNLQEEKDKSFDTLQAFALENQDELFNKKKSLEMVHGTIGFRTGTPKLKTLKGFTWASALQLVKEFLPNFIRKTEEIAKDRLLTERETDIIKPGDPLGPAVPLREVMVKCGITIVQEESFFVEPKKEDGAV
ncbi:MAG: host-nuclease inhibitor Gam family protein [Muribaculaceae bacterium]|nr:host-nuclease inhibitor Gam family protein [Muribaculaceae bacterium]